MARTSHCRSLCPTIIVNTGDCYNYRFSTPPLFMEFHFLGGAGLCVSPYSRVHNLVTHYSVVVVQHPSLVTNLGIYCLLLAAPSCAIPPHPVTSPNLCSALPKPWEGSLCSPAAFIVSTAWAFACSPELFQACEPVTLPMVAWYSTVSIL
jgi:hypothetical protein